MKSESSESFHDLPKVIQNQNLKFRCREPLPMLSCRNYFSLEIYEREQVFSMSQTVVITNPIEILI